MGKIHQWKKQTAAKWQTMNHVHNPGGGGGGGGGF